jgi:hypothetical protein
MVDLAALGCFLLDLHQLLLLFFFVGKQVFLLRTVVIVFFVRLIGFSSATVLRKVSLVGPCRRRILKEGSIWALWSLFSRMDLNVSDIIDDMFFCLVVGVIGKAFALKSALVILGGVSGVDLFEAWQVVAFHLIGPDYGIRVLIDEYLLVDLFFFDGLTTFLASVFLSALLSRFFKALCFHFRRFAKSVLIAIIFLLFNCMQLDLQLPNSILLHL